jgi:hypothetical protein
MPTISVIRVLQFIGTADWVQATLARRAVKGSHAVPGGGVIREALLGDPFELISTPAPTADLIGFGLRAQSSGEKPTWDDWVDNEMNGLRHLVASGQLDPGTADTLKAQLDRVREFANMP